ncbi:MAG: hypothetical protein J0L82_00990 [Deltaproteobacteria bacterium]|nr:hypothetical protein [Deltaproteobacteria bacterium]
MKQLIIFSAIFLALGVASAHEGHDKTPGALAAPHGGLVKGTDHIYLELVTESGGIKIYPLNHDTKPIPVADVKLEGKMSVPRKNKAETVKFTVDGDHFVAKVDAKGAHRYDLDITVTHGGKAEKLKFSVEPQ